MIVGIYVWENSRKEDKHAIQQYQRLLEDHDRWRENNTFRNISKTNCAALVSNQTAVTMPVQKKYSFRELLSWSRDFIMCASVRRTRHDSASATFSCLV